MTEQRETVVVSDGGSSSGLVLGIVAIVLVIAGLWFFLLGPGSGTTTAPSGIDVNVTLPSVAPAAS